MQRGDGKPIFIVGSPRSGTSVLTWCLGQHPNILPLPETHWIARLTVHMRQLYQFGTVHGRYSHLGALDWTEQDFYAAFGKVIDQFVVETREPRLKFIRKLSAKKQGLSEKQIAELEKNGSISPDPAVISAKNYQVVRSPDDPKRRWVDGTPENTFYMYSLSLLFPGARFIHLLRRPNQVARSLMGFSRAGGAGTDSDEASAFLQWQRNVEYALKGERALGPKKVIRIHYETLVAHPEETLRGILDFVGEEFSPHCLLPFQEIINSSKAHEQPEIFPNTKEGVEANRLYEQIPELLPEDTDIEAMKELSQHFINFSNDVNIR